MIICAHCGTLNMEGTFFCTECGRNISGGTRVPGKAGSTVVVPPSPEDTSTTGSGDIRAFGGTAYVGKSTEILIKVNNVEVARIQPRREITLGRSDVETAFKPDIDFANFNALDLGVSRRHAMLKLSDGDITLQDMNSSNGTFLNGQRLLPNQPRLLHNGDEVRLGKLVAHIFFVQS